MRQIYLDNNATTPLHPQVKEAIISFLDTYGNAGSLHNEGRASKAAVEEARAHIAGFFGVHDEDFVFTSCASEANNQILKSVLYQSRDFQPHVIVSAIEHPSIIETARFLQSRGVSVDFVPVNSDGVIDFDAFTSLVKKQTVLVSVMLANNEIGTLQPVEQIGNFLKERGVYFHSDTSQAAGLIDVAYRDLAIDAASLSAHKMYAPKGIGLLYARNITKSKFIIPFFHGGHQERGFRAGTENTLGIIAFGAACRVMKSEVSSHASRMAELTRRFEKAVSENIPDIIINGKNAPRKPGTSNISFRFIEGESILLRLDMHGICVSTGSACSTGSLDPSHVIMALHHDPESAHGSIRFSMGRETTVEDIDYTVEKLKETVEFLRSISPLGKKA